MDFSLREWLILIGIGIIVIILVDGFRRYRQTRALEESGELDAEALQKEAMIRRELPSGGARAIVTTELKQQDDPVKDAFENAKVSVDAKLTDLPHKLTIGPSFEQKDDLQLEALEALVPEKEPEIVEEKDYPIEDDEVDIREEVEGEFEKEYSNVDVSQITPLGTIDAEEEDAPKEDIEEVIVINVFADKDNPFIGMELLQLVLNCGMRYGDMDIFHRHEDGFDRGKIQFSMANAIEPGTFDLDTMGETTSSGVSFFMGLPGPKNSMKAFDYMLETAQAMTNNFGGELRDERRSLMSNQSIEHCRQRIRDFERRRLMRSKQS